MLTLDRQCHARTADLVSDYSFDHLLSEWHKTLSHQHDPASDQKVEAIEEEWQYREVDIFQPEPDEDEMPWLVSWSEDAFGRGLLGVLGYHIGIARGDKAIFRRRLLARLAVAKLPIVQSPDYMRKWGAPTSNRRRLAILAAVGRLCESKGKHAAYGAAVGEWQSDLRFLQTHLFP